MKQIRRTLDSVSGYLFMAGFMTARLKYVPIMMASALLNLTSLLAFLIGYLTWYAAALFYPAQRRKEKAWYGFAEFKDQFQITALLGLIASILCIIAPPLIIPTAWLFTISNSFWVVSEFHKQENPPHDDELHSSTKQAHYLRYTLFIAAGSLVAAIGATATLIWPAFALLIISSTTVLGIGLTISSLYHWAQAAFGQHQPDHLKTATQPIEALRDSSLDKAEPRPQNEHRFPFFKPLKQDESETPEPTPTP